MRILFTFLLLVLSQQGMAVNCSEENITLSTQEDVDGFQDTYGPCDTVSGDLIISGSMTNLDGLLKLKNVERNLLIERNSNLSNIKGLGDITFIGGSLKIVVNPELSSLDKTSNRNVKRILMNLE